MKCQTESCSSSITSSLHTGLGGKRVCSLCYAKLNLKLEFSRDKLGRMCTHVARIWQPRADGTFYCLECEAEKQVEPPMLGTTGPVL